MNGELEAWAQFKGMVLEKLTSIEAKLDKVNGRLDGHSKRIRVLELWRSGLASAFTALLLAWGMLKDWKGWGK